MTSLGASDEAHVVLTSSHALSCVSHALFQGKSPVWKGREGLSSRLEVKKDSSLTWGVNGGKPPFLAVKFSLRVHSNK